MKINKSILSVFCGLTLFAHVALASTPTMSKDSVGGAAFEQNQKYKYLYYEGISQKNLGNLDASFDLFRHCVDIAPERQEAYYELGSLYMNLKQYDVAIASFEKAVELDSLNYWYNESLFIALYSQPNRASEAIHQLESMIVRFPDNMNLQLQLLEMYSQSSEYDKVVALLDKIEDKLGKSEQLSMQKFGAYLEAGQEDKAFREIEDLIKAYPNDLRYQAIMANLYINVGKYKQAGKILDAVLKKEPNNSLALFTLTEYYDKTEQTDKYIDQIRKVILDVNQDTELRLNLMRQYIVKVNSEASLVVPLFDEIIETIPEDDQIAMLYTQYLSSIKRDKDTAPVLKHILNIDPTNTAARLMLLSLAIRANDYSEVIEICKEGIISSPESIEFYFYLSVAYHQAGEKEKVLETASKALEVVDASTPSEVVSDFYAIMGDVYHEMGETKKVYEAYDKALELTADNVGVLNNYAYYLSVDRKELDKAEEMSRKTVDKEPKNATFLDTYAWILFELKRYDEAKIYIEQAIENGGDSSSVIVEHAGDIYYMLNDKEAAMKYWLQADSMENPSSKLKLKIKRKKYIQ